MKKVQLDPLDKRPLDNHGWAERWWLQATQIVAVVIFTVVQILGATRMHHSGLKSNKALSQAISSKMVRRLWPWRFLTAD